MEANADLGTSLVLDTAKAVPIVDVSSNGFLLCRGLIDERT